MVYGLLPDSPMFDLPAFLLQSAGVPLGQKFSTHTTPQDPRGPAYLKPSESHLGGGGRAPYLLMLPGDSTVSQG